MKFLTRYNHANPEEGDFGPSATSQQYKDECDVDVMMQRFKCGQPLPVKASGVYGDFSAIGDYQDCLNKVTRANEEFAALPSHIRERFGHDPKLYMDFVLNPDNEDDCVKLGLRVKPTVSPSQRVIESLETIAGVVTRKGVEGPVAATVQ